MRLLIIRHGDPDYEHNTLTQKGWREAEFLSRKLEKEEITAAYCSPLGRAQHTAKPTLEKTGLSCETLPWLEEFPLPVFPPFQPTGACPWGLPSDYWTSFPGIMDREQWRNTDLFKDTGIPERYDEITHELDALIEKHGFVRRGEVYDALPGHEEDRQTIALFCHMGLGLLLINYILGASLPVTWHRMFLPTSSVTTCVMEKRGDYVLRLASVGDTSHLYACGEPVSDSGFAHALR